MANYYLLLKFEISMMELITVGDLKKLVDGGVKCAFEFVKVITTEGIDWTNITCGFYMVDADYGNFMEID